MELWFATLVVILVMMAIGAVVARASQQEEPDHGLGPVLAVRLVVVLFVTRGRRRRRQEPGADGSSPA